MLDNSLRSIHDAEEAHQIISLFLLSILAFSKLLYVILFTEKFILASVYTLFVRKKDILIGISVFIALVIILMVFSPRSSSLESREYESKPVLKVVVRRFSRDEFGYCHVYGEVKNVGSRDAEFVKVAAAFYGKNKNIIGSSYTYTSPYDIPAGGSAPFHVIWMDEQGCRMAEWVKVWVESW